MMPATSGKSKQAKEIPSKVPPMDVPHLRHAFGLATGLQDNVMFVGETSVLYPVGRFVSIQNTETKAATFLPASAGCHRVTALSLCPRRRYLAVCERVSCDAGLGNGGGGSGGGGGGSGGSGSGGVLARCSGPVGLSGKGTFGQLSVWDVKANPAPKRLRVLIDDGDAALATEIASEALRVRVAKTLMNTLDDRINLAHTALKFISEIS